MRIAAHDRGGRLHEALWAGAAAAVSLLAGLVALRVWKEDLSIPFTYSGDGNFYTMLVKDTLDHGWFLTNPDLGWPSGQQLYDFPMGGDNGAFALIRLLGVFSGSAAVVVNLFFLATFPLVGLAAFLVFRRLGVSRAASLVTAAVYAILPYHVHRNEGHLTLGLYVAIPLVVLLLVRIIEDKPLLVLADRRRSLLVVLACLIIASTGIGYHALFAVALLIFVGPAAALVHRSGRPLRQAASLSVLIAAILAVNLAPSLIYSVEHGTNLGLPRVPHETEFYAFNLTRLVLPPADARFAPARHLSQGYQNSTSLPGAGEGAAYLGLIGAAGLALLLGIILLRVIGARGSLIERLGPAAAIGGIAFLIGTTDGLATLFAYIVTPKFHGAGRISLVIAFVSLLAVGVVLDLAFARLHRRGRRGVVAVAAVCAALLGFALYDQALLPYTPGDPARNAAWRSDDAFVKRIEATLPGGASVFQLPIVTFIEYTLPPGKLQLYELLRPYLHSRDLRWSYGALRGRPSDWQTVLAGAQPRQLLPWIVAVGFEGLYVNRVGFDDPDQTRRTLTELTGVQPLVSQNGRLEFYDLRDYASRFRATHNPAAIARLRQRVLQRRVAS